LANTVFKLRRSSVAGKSPNTSTLSIGELAINLTDRKLFSSDGTNIFETGSNLTSLSVFSDISIGNSSVNLSINSTSFSGTANNSTNLGGTAAASYQLNSTLNANIASYLPTYTGIVNGSSITVGTSTISNSTGVFTTGTVNGAILSVGTSVVANTSRLVIGTGVGLQANGGIGTAGQVLSSNGTTIYWSTPSGSGTVTSVATGNGLTGGPITSTGTVSVLANNGITANSTGLFVTQGTGAVVNATGIHVNAAYINTISSNSAAFLAGNTVTTNSTVLSVGTLGVNSSGITANTFQIGTATYVTATGNVGIGTSSPVTTLDVRGTISVAGANVLSQTLTYAANTAWDTSLGQIATVTLTANTNFNNPTNLKIGTYILNIIQDATGSRTATWSSSFKWPAATAPVLTTTGARRDIVFFYSDGTNLYGSFLPDVR
jgi:hypothetical protein